MHALHCQPSVYVNTSTFIGHSLNVLHVNHHWLLYSNFNIDENFHIWLSLCRMGSVLTSCQFYLRRINAHWKDICYQGHKTFAIYLTTFSVPFKGLIRNLFVIVAMKRQTWTRALALVNCYVYIHVPK